MSSKERKKAALYEKLQLLRSVTNSSASQPEMGGSKQLLLSHSNSDILYLPLSKTSIIVDATKYIEDLKQKVDRLNQDIGTSQFSADQNPLPVVKVETLERGFLINVFSERNCPGLLVSILETFEELGLNVLDARVSCSDSFHLEAVGGENEGQHESIDAQVVKQAVMQAIKNWT